MNWIGEVVSLKSDVRLGVLFVILTLSSGVASYIFYESTLSTVFQGVLTGCIVSLCAVMVSYASNVQKVINRVAVIGSRFSALLTAYSTATHTALLDLKHEKISNEVLEEVLTRVTSSDEGLFLGWSFGSLKSYETNSKYINQLLGILGELQLLNSELHSVISDLVISKRKLKILRGFARDITTICWQLTKYHNNINIETTLEKVELNSKFLRFEKYINFDSGKRVKVYSVGLSRVIWEYNRVLELRLKRNPLLRGKVLTDRGKKLYISGGSSVKEELVLSLMNHKEPIYIEYMTSIDLKQYLVDILEEKGFKFGEQEVI